VIWDDTKTVAFDFEASGTTPEYALQPWRYAAGDFWTTSISVIQHTGTQLTPWMSKLFPTVEDKRAFLQAAIDNDWTVVTWNGIYDISILIAYGLRDLVFEVRWLDGLLLWKHLEIDPEYDIDKPRKKSYALKPDAVNRFIPGFADTTGADEVDFHSTDPAELAKLQHYNNRDSVRTLVITKLIWDQLTDKQRNAALIEAEAIPFVAEANLNGMPIDTLFASELAAWLQGTAAKKLDELGPHGVTEQVVRSPTKMAALLFDQWGLPVYKENTGKKTGNVSRSTDKEVLHELAFIDPRCKSLKEYREALNNDTKFAQAPLVSADYNGDGRTRPSGIMFGTYTGRMTYASSQGKGVGKRQTGFALHQEKRGKEFRGIVQAPPGYTIVEFDAAGQEFRWMAVKSGDTNMLQLCLPGEDAHSYMGSRIVGKDYREVMVLSGESGSREEQDRYFGKVANLSLQYRTYPKTFRKVARVQYDIPLELPEAQRIHRVYQQTYPQVPIYWNLAIEQAKRQGYAETLAGRRVALVGDWGGSLSWKMESTALNYPIQGTGGDQKYLAIKLLKDFILSVGGYFAWDLHDGLYWFIPDNMVDRVVAQGKHILDNLPYQQAWGFTPPIPMPWDCKFGKVWGALKKAEEG
jgi:DNA polymerase I-like protein with 3'-5' exonuclease and polymerase domains